MLVEFFPRAEMEALDERFRFAIVAARHRGRWLFCRHRERETYELPGGHRELGEAIEATARRELYEETGATAFVLEPIGPYAVTGPTWENPGGDTTYGMLFLAFVEALGPLPDLEMAEVAGFETLPEHCTYPDIQPHLFSRAVEALESREQPDR